MANLIQYRGPFAAQTQIGVNGKGTFSVSINQKDNCNRANLQQHKNGGDLSDNYFFVLNYDQSRGVGTTIYLGKTGMYQENQILDTIRLLFPNGAPHSLTVNIATI